MLTGRILNTYCFKYLLFVTLFFACSVTNALVDEVPLGQLRQLFEVMLKKPCDHLTLEEMNTHAQANWLRKPGQERWQMDPNAIAIDAVQKAAIRNALEALGFIAEVVPVMNHADYIVILGSTVTNMRRRTAYALKVLEHMPAANVVYLTGNRKLDPVKESQAVLLDKREIRVRGWKQQGALPDDENEVAVFIWTQITTKRCEVFPTFKDGARPTTNDTIKTLLQHLPKDRVISIIFVSANPYVPYQRETIKPLIMEANAKGYKLQTEMVGPANVEDAEGEKDKDDNIKSIEMLDNFARYIYSILTTQKAEEKFMGAGRAVAI